MKTCNSCGAQMNDNDRFCMSCGADQRIENAAPAAEPVTPVAEPVQQTYEAPVQQTYEAPAQSYSYDASSSSIPGEDPAHGLAVASLVLGIIGLLCCTPCSLVGLILAIVAKSKGSKSGMATAGIVLGAIGIAFSVILLILNALGYASFYINY